MAGIDAKVWYILRDAATSINNTLTAGFNTQAAFDPNSASAIYFAPQNATNIGAQLWQLFQVNASRSSAYILRNCQLGSAAYLTTAETSRKCGGGKCATVPILSPNLNTESLWNFGSWGFDDLTGGAYVYNLGNGSIWRLDVMDGGVLPVVGVSPELVNYDDTGRLAQHWFVNSYTTLAASESSNFATVPSAATTLLAQYTDGSSNGSTASVTPYLRTSAASTSASTSTTGSSGPNSTNSSSATHNSNLSTGAAIGIGVGVACLVFLVAGILAFICFQRRRSRKDVTTPNPVEVPTHNAPLRDENVKYAELGSPPSPRSPATSQSTVSQSINSMSAELMSPSERSRVELEHPSTRLAATWFHSQH